jgi:hypothetical protein
VRTLRALIRTLAAAGSACLFTQEALAACPSDVTTEVIPLPVYATLPNEGSTWGAMPVFLRVCPDDRRTQSIIAPSVTWNDVIHVTGTFRWYEYPSDEKALAVIASASSRINYNFFLAWQNAPLEVGTWSDDVSVRVQRSAFFRFFGLGPDTAEDAETSYTGLRAFASARRGLTVLPHLNLGATLRVEHDGVQDLGVPGLATSPQVFPDAPGMGGATLLSQGLDVLYDDRRGGDYAERGLRADLGGSVVEGLAGSPTFLRAGLDVRAIVPEFDGFTGAAHLAWSWVSSGSAPFYQQSSLGGAFLLRGFTEDRFIDRQAWTIELEQRIRAFQTEILGVVADWRVDPFVGIGQVFGDLDSIASRPRVTAGIGLRAFVHPNVVGRVDIAYGGEGIKAYVELGYPY